MKHSEIQERADFSTIRYAQCWEDSALLQAALLPTGRRCLSIGSAGDNSFALLAGGASHVTAVEMNPSQIACIDLRRAAYLTLDHPEFLELIGSRPSERRAKFYEACRSKLAKDTRDFWDRSETAIAAGIGSAGRFERYFELFRRRVLPFAHNRERVSRLLEPRPADERKDFYRTVWNNRRWRGLFAIFFSRSLMGLLGRDPEFFRYVEGSVADRILSRTRHALEVLDPSDNPYLHWILKGTHGDSLPEALEERNFEPIRRSLLEDRLEVVQAPLERLIEDRPAERFDAFNLSDIFEYMSEANSARLLSSLVAASNPGARLAYWNMLAPRSRPESMAGALQPLDEVSRSLFARDRAFFYSRFVVEETTGTPLP